MTEEMREQMLNVMFNESSEEEVLNESEESLDEGVIGQAIQNAGRAIGTGVKHAAQNAVNDVRNSFAFTAKQKAQAANRTATLKANQAAENAGNKALAKAGKAGRASYKDVMSKWSIKSANDAMQKAIKAQDIDTFVSGLFYALCGINVLDAGKAQGNTTDAKQQKNLDNAKASNKEIGNTEANAAKDNKANQLAANADISGNNGGKQ